MRRGVTLVELVVTMVVFAIVMALLARAAVFHERFQRQERAVEAGHRAARQAAAIAVSALAGAASEDLTAGQATDSALDFMAPIGAGIACAAGDALILAAAAPASGPALASLAAFPGPGDRVAVYDDRGLPARWRSYIVVGTASGGAQCAAVGAPPSPTITLRLDAPVGTGPVAAFRLARRTRLAAYRSGDGAWYLGLRDWNGDANRFNGVQPVAGPLRPRTGFHLDYLDAAGRPLDVPVVSPSDAASVVVKALAADSAAAAVERVVALRRAP